MYVIESKREREREGEGMGGKRDGLCVNMHAYVGFH